MLGMFARVTVLALIVLFAGAIGTPASTLFVLEGHQSSLHAVATMRDGTARTVTLQGVGCAQGMCSRVRVKDGTSSVWLDRLASVRDISQNSDGTVQALLTFKDGASHQASIIALNRVLYVGSLLWTRQLDLTKVRQIDFGE